MDGGFYPHTIRIDAKDRVWFTLALSNQVAMFDRAASRFTLYDLPYRGFMEELTVRLTPFLFKLIGWGLPLTNWVRDRPRVHRRAAALRHRHRTRRQGLDRPPAHRRDRLHRPGHAARSR